MNNRKAKFPRTKNTSKNIIMGIGAALAFSAAGVGTAFAGSVGDAAAKVDWSAVPADEVVAFLPGTTSIEWVLHGPDHSGARVFRAGDRCYWCHEGEEREFGDNRISGVHETENITSKRGYIPMAVQAAFDDDNLYMRFQWEDKAHSPLPFVDGGKMDAKNPVKLSVSIAGEGFQAAKLAGCWMSCHHDSRSMPDDQSGSDRATRATKYLADSRTGLEIAGAGGAPRGGWDKRKPDGEIASLKSEQRFLEISRWLSGSNATETSAVLAERKMQPGEAVHFEGELNGGVWTVRMTRSLRPGKPDMLDLDTDEVYTVGFAIHDDHTNARFHHVSFERGLAFGQGSPDEEFVDINAVRLN